MVHNVKDGSHPCPVGANDICDDPLLNGPFSGDTYGMEPTSTSPGNDNGLGVGELGLIPANDIDGQSRPQGSGVDRGAYEL